MCLKITLATARRDFRGKRGSYEVNKEALAEILVTDARAWTRLLAQSWREVKGNIGSVEPAGLETWSREVICPVKA